MGKVYVGKIIWLSLFLSNVLTQNILFNVFLQKEK